MPAPRSHMGKIDLKNAFRLIPVRREDWYLLGIHWQNKWYVNQCLSFSLRSSPALFNQLATAIQWILQQNYGVEHLIHYLDDTFTAGPPNSPACSHNMATINHLSTLLNTPTKPEKEEGYSSRV